MPCMSHVSVNLARSRWYRTIKALNVRNTLPRLLAQVQKIFWSLHLFITGVSPGQLPWLLRSPFEISISFPWLESLSAYDACITVLKSQRGYIIGLDASAAIKLHNNIRLYTRSSNVPKSGFGKGTVDGRSN